MTSIHAAAVGAALLSAAVAAFQIALALGMPMGEAVFGGRAPTRNGVLTERFRVIAAASALVLLLIGWIILARAGVVSGGPFGDAFLVWATRGILAFLVLNTAGNFAAPHPVERWVMGSISSIMVVLIAVIVLGAP